MFSFYNFLYVKTTSYSRSCLRKFFSTCEFHLHRRWNDCNRWHFAFQDPYSKPFAVISLFLCFAFLYNLKRFSIDWRICPMYIFRFRRLVILYIVIVVVTALSIARILITLNSKSPNGCIGQEKL